MNAKKKRNENAKAGKLTIYITMIGRKRKEDVRLQVRINNGDLIGC